MKTEDLYTAPSDEIFNKVKSKSIQIWKTYDNQFGYVDEKVSRVEKINNFKDNCTYIVAMFDSFNQDKLVNSLEGKAKKWVGELLTYSRGY